MSFFFVYPFFVFVLLIACLHVLLLTFHTRHALIFFNFLCRQVPGMLVTCSIDKTVALWDTQNASPSPQPCGSKDMNVGKLYTVSCYPSSPWLLSCGGSGNGLALWDMESEEAIQNRFASRVSGGGSASKNDADEPDFEAIMATGEDAAASKALEGMNKSKKKKGKKKKIHRKGN